MQKPESLLQKKIESCTKCARLREHCLEIGRVKRAAYRDQVYSTLPVSGFGDINAQVVIVGLAPGAHGANRTGRVFTGDQSGLWLYRALHRAGLSNQPQSVGPGDGLSLKNAYVTCVVKCAPPGNKPLPAEWDVCAPFLNQELVLLNQARVYIALGAIAYQRLAHALDLRAKINNKKLNSKSLPKFKHGASVEWHEPGSSPVKKMILSYHPSQQNTFTKKLTEPMFDAIFFEALDWLKKEVKS